MFDLFHQPPLQGELLRDAGIQTAAAHADQVSDAWNEKAYKLLVGFISYHFQFTCEQFRAWSEGQLPAPPSLRAYGALMVRAAKDGLIKQDGYVKVTNAKAHRATAALWKRIYK